MTLTVLFTRTRPIRPERSVTWGYRSDQDRHFRKNASQPLKVRLCYQSAALQR